MNSKKLFYVLIVLTGAVIGAGIMAIVQGDKKLSQQNSELTALKIEANSLENVQQSLILAKKDIAMYADIEQITKTVVPLEKDQARTVREIIKLAAESKISIASVTFPSSTLGTKATPGAAAPTGGASATQLQKVEGINNVERLEITVTSDTTKPVLYTDLLQFLEKLEQNRRTSQVGNVNIQPDTENRNRLTFTLLLNVYIKKN